MRKKLLILLVALAMVASLFAGCKKAEEPMDATEAPTEAAATEAVEEPTDEMQEEVVITGKELFKNVNARKAFSLGYDKEFIIVDINGDKGDLASTSYTPVGFASGPAGTAYEGIDFVESLGDLQGTDIAVAQEAWAIAKEELGFDKAEVEFLNYDSDGAAKVAEHVKEELERNLEGLTLTILPLPFAEKLDLIDAGDFEFTYAGWGPDYQNPLTFLDMWITDGPYNSGHYSNPDYDMYIETAKTSTDPTEAWEALLAADTLITEEFPIGPMYQRGLMTLVSSDVTGMIKHGFGPDYTYKWVEKAGSTTLNLLESTDIPDLDANDATDTLSFEMLNNVCEGLYRLGEGDVPILQGATAVEYADGAYTFTLNEDAKWVTSDGEVYGNVTAADYVYSWTRLGSEELGAQYGFLLGIVGIEEVVAVDDYTLKVVAPKTTLFESMMTFPSFLPVNEKFVNEVGAEDFGTTADKTLYNGPFYLAEWELTSHTAAKKNPHYWEADVVKLEEIYTRYITGVENNTAVQMYLDGEIDRSGLSGENVALYKDRDDVVPVMETTCFYLQFNVGDY